MRFNIFDLVIDINAGKSWWEIVNDWKKWKDEMKNEI